MRNAGIIERVPMVDRIAQDIFSSIMRQYEGRGEEWLISTGGLGRLDESVMKLLIKNTKTGNLNISKVQEILSDVPIPDQKILINTLGGRMPYGIRISGIDLGQFHEFRALFFVRSLQSLCYSNPRVLLLSEKLIPTHSVDFDFLI